MDSAFRNVVFTFSMVVWKLGVNKREAEKTPKRDYCIGGLVVRGVFCAREDVRLNFKLKFNLCFK